MKIRSLLIPIASLAFILFLPAGFTQGADTKQQQTPDELWVWPLPPEKPRVKHTRTFITPEDLGVKKGFFSRLWDFVAGKDTADRILSPHGITADGKGKVYVVDWGAASIHYFDFKRKKYSTFGKTKRGPLVSPIGAALDAKGRLYVTDSVKRRVFVFKGTKNKKVIGDDSLKRPTGIAIVENKIYVVDTVGHRVDVFDVDGSKQFSFGKRGDGNGEFNYPTHVAADREGNIYVMDSLNFRVQIFDGNGSFLSRFGSNGTSIHDFIKPKGIAVDSEGHIWVSDGLRNSIQIFDRKGRLLLIFGKTGIKRGEFSVPAGLYIDRRDRVYVADSYNYRVQEFQYLNNTVSTR